jgi:hypothetical protein
MKSVSKNIKDHLDKHHNIYINALGVQTLFHRNEYVCLVAPWPGIANDDGDYVIEICAQADSIDNLITIAGIYTFQQYLDFSPTHLLDLYHQGKAIVACVIDREGLFYEIDFIISDNHVWALDKNNEARMLSVPPETPEDFFCYLRECARLNSIIL